MLRNKLTEVRLIIIDKISMVSSEIFYQVNQRLNEIFGYSGNEPFAGHPVIVCGDFFLLKGLPVYSRAECSINKRFSCLRFLEKISDGRID